MIICPSQKCTGCAACAGVCPRKCITFTENELGVLLPVVNDSKCVTCQKCQQVCPNNNGPKFRYPIKCFAAWITDEIKRKECASGGIGTAIAEYLIAENNGVVFGTAYDKNLMPRTILVDSINDVQKLKGSKYVQGIVDKEIYYDIKRYCDAGRRVAYIGLPCQIAGLLNFLGKGYDNLLTVDLICHGVCPARYLKEEVEYLKGRYKIPDVSNIRFRGNDGNDFCLTLWDEKGNRVYNGDWWSHNRYFLGFMMGITLRENCYNCLYARPERVSDITIGDFIGLGAKIPFSYNTKNVSSVTVNTKKGEAFYISLIASNSSIQSIERDYSERLEYRPSLMEPFRRHKYNARFIELCKRIGYRRAISSVLARFVFFSRLKGLVLSFVRKSRCLIARVINF